MLLITTAYEEKAVLGKVGAKIDTIEKEKKLYAYRLQQHLANKILFSNLWQFPKDLAEISKKLGLADDKTVKFYLEQLKD